MAASPNACTPLERNPAAIKDLKVFKVFKVLKLLKDLKFKI